MVVLGLMVGIPVGAIFVFIYILFGNDESLESYRSPATKFAFMSFVLLICALTVIMVVRFQWGLWAFGFLGAAGWSLVLSAISGFWHEFENAMDGDRASWLVGAFFFLVSGFVIVGYWDEFVASLS